MSAWLVKNFIMDNLTDISGITIYFLFFSITFNVFNEVSECCQELKQNYITVKYEKQNGETILMIAY